MKKEKIIALTLAISSITGALSFKLKLKQQKHHIFMKNTYMDKVN